MCAPKIKKAPDDAGALSCAFSWSSAVSSYTQYLATTGDLP